MKSKGWVRAPFGATVATARPLRRRQPLHLIRESIGVDQANQEISSAILEGGPFLAGRLGSTELRTIQRFAAFRVPSIPLRLLTSFRQGHLPFFTRFENRKLSVESGFYPIDRASISRFSEIYSSAMGAIDLLGSWLPGEEAYSAELRRATVTELHSFEPFWASNPWTSALEGKKVLVVHPFAETIRTQFELHRGRLFHGGFALPPFDLVTLKAVQSLGIPDPRFSSWFDALNWMVQRSALVDWDVAIVGCGAYGLPLAAELKRQGRVVIHFGGGTQLLFGIRGQRWESIERYRLLSTPAWTYPRKDETPDRPDKLARGAYWGS